MPEFWTPPGHTHYEPPPSPLQQLKRNILADFSAWLDELDAEDLRAATDPPEDDSAPDLFSFFSELAALRRDVQLQGKASQGLRSDVQDVTNELKTGVEEQVRNLANAVIDIKNQVPRARREAQTAIALEFVEIAEGLERCRDLQTPASLPLFLTRGRREAVLRELHRPIGLLAAKAGDALRRLGIRSIAAVGDTFSPGTMRAADTTSGSGRASGTVTEIVRQGYTLNDDVLRVAEVKVEK